MYFNLLVIVVLVMHPYQTYEQKHQSELKLPFSVNWQELALFAAQHRDELSSTQLMQLNSRIKSSVDMKGGFNGEQNLQLGIEVGSFLRGYESELP